MLKDKNSSALYIVIDAAKKLSLKNDEDIVLLTNIISDAINYNAACMTNLVSTTCQISNKDIKEKITLAISKCKDEEKARCLYHLAQKSNDLLNIFGYQETINIINKINKIDDYDYYDNSYQFINNYLEYIKKTNKNNYIKPSTVINIITKVKNKKNLPLFIDIIPTGILEKDNAIDYLNIIKSDIEYSKAISLIFINNKQNKKRILKKSS